MRWQLQNSQNWFTAGLWLQRGNLFNATSLADIYPWLYQGLSVFAHYPPPGIILDIGQILARKPLLKDNYIVQDETLRACLLRYEEYFLGRLLIDRRLESLQLAYFKLSTTQQEQAINVVVEQLLHHLKLEFATPAPSLLRRTLQTPSQELMMQGIELLENDRELIDYYATEYLKIAQAAQRSSFLLTKSMIEVVEHLHALATPSQRLNFSEINQAANLLELHLPKRLIKNNSKQGDRATKLTEASTYPTGGFSEISTKGGLENLVSSELIYMEEGHQVDWFDLRWSNNELLKYHRDDGVFLREQRIIYFVLHENLEKLRYKDPLLPHQHLVLVIGLLLTLVKRLHLYLSDNALAIYIFFPHGFLSEERRLVSLALSDLIEQNIVILRQDTDNVILKQAEEEEAQCLYLTTKALTQYHYPISQLNFAHTLPEWSYKNQKVVPKMEKIQGWQEIVLYTLKFLI